MEPPEDTIMSPFSLRSGGLPSRIFLSLALGLSWLSPSLHAKTAGLTAIVVYPGASGQAYQQVGDLVLSGKNELLLCSGTTGIDKNVYHKLGKVTLTTGMMLERTGNGVLMLTQASAPAACVLPGNVKYDKNEAYTAAQLGDKLDVEGRVLSGSDPALTQITPIKPGVKIVFVAAPDPELAEYLRADRQNDIAGWQFYLGKYAATPHSGAAKKSLGALFLAAGTADLQAYTVTASASTPAYAKLKEARAAADQAHTLVPDDATIAGLGTNVHAQVLTLSKQAQDALTLYQQALKQQTAGYVNLVAAEGFAGGAFSVEPSTAEAAAAESQTKQARAALESVLHDTESAISAHHSDEAAQKIVPVRCLSADYDRVASDLKQISALYVAHAKVLEEQPDWPAAVKELENAEATVASPETEDLLKSAREQALMAANKAAADDATQKSVAAQGNNDILTAYEVLDNLPPDQHALVADRLASLKDIYVPAAEKAATGLQKAHEPINGIGDESGIRLAYNYLQRCFQITNDPTLQDRIAILGGDLSSYYLAQGKHYAEKPDGTGVNVGWTYLAEALQYKSSTDSGAIHDELTNARAAHLLKSRLSVKVDFRDQTSRREAVDFATQLTDSLATGLESSGLDVKVIRSQETTQVQPNFQLVGDVVRHEMVKSQQMVPKESKYRFGQEEIPNPDWNEINRQYESANNDLQSARSALEGAQARGKKGEIKKADEGVQDAEKKVDALRVKLDTIPKTKSQDVERPYNYTEVVNHLRIAVELQYRILDSSGEEAVARVPVAETEPDKQYSILENVKPDDTLGIRVEGVIPNDNDFFEADEYKVRDELIAKAKETVAQLPGLVLTRADRKAQDGDNDGAAELYILYLNSTPVADTPDRLRARKFLAEQFNFRDIGKEAPVE
jgi:hypothetical protein